MPRPRTCPARFSIVLVRFIISNVFSASLRDVYLALRPSIRGHRSRDSTLSLSLFSLRSNRSFFIHEKRTTNDRERTTAHARGRQVYRAENTAALHPPFARGGYEKQREYAIIGIHLRYADYRTRMDSTREIVFLSCFY